MSVAPFLASQLAAIVDYADLSVRNGWYGTRELEALRCGLLGAAREIAALRPGAELNDERDALDRWAMQAGQDVPLEGIFDDGRPA